jgi:uncharacterized protein YjeT (DUF2065 family)
MVNDLLVALSLVLVIEGILPFASPKRWRALAATIATVEDRTVRAVGLGSMVCGTLLLYLVH